MTRKWAASLIALLLCAVAWAEQPAGAPVKSSVKSAVKKPVWLVVTRPMFVKALQPLVEHRRKDGFETIVSTDPIQAAIKKSPRPPKYLLLVGDDEPGKQNQPWYLPARQIKQCRWSMEQKPTYPSDAAFGDRNQDRFPDFPVGRLPVRTETQAETIVRKILAYEAQPPRIEDTELLLWAGSTQYGAAFDRLAAKILDQMMTKGIPGWLEPFAISANHGTTLYCRIRDHFGFFHHRLQRRPGFTCLIGHGNETIFFLGTMLLKSGKKGYGACNSDFFAYKRADRNPLSPVIILACLCGQFSNDKTSLAEELVLQPAGPVACIAASAESHPVPNLYTGQAMLQTLRQPGRLGDFWLRTLRIAGRIHNPFMETILKFAEGSMTNNANLEKIRQDHATLYQLFGDPATQTRIPQRLECTVKQNGDGTWKWTAGKPKDAIKLYVTFRPDTKTKLLPPKNSNDIQAVRKVFLQAIRRLSFKQLSELSADTPWTGTVDTPGMLRLVAVGKKQIYVAARKLTSPAVILSCHPERSAAESKELTSFNPNSTK